MKTNLFAIAIALAAGNAFGAECPARAGVCQSYEPTVSVAREYHGTPVAQVIGRGTPALAITPSTTARTRVVSTQHLYKFGRA